MQAKPRFLLGQIVATPGALAALKRSGAEAHSYISRHISGDWGAVSEADIALNEQALRDGARLLSCYSLPDETKIWIITEADRSSSCLLLPSEY